MAVVGRVSGSLRRRNLHRQGIVRRGMPSRPALEGRAPENAVLSHDLFEGLYAPDGPRVRYGGGGRLPVERPGARAAASTVGAGATGRSCSGCFPSSPRAGGSNETDCRSSRAGRSSTTSGAAWSRPPRSPFCSAAGPISRGARRSGRSSPLSSVTISALLWGLETVAGPRPVAALARAGARCAPGHQDRRRARVAAADVRRVSGLPDDHADRHHDRADRRHASQDARVADRRGNGPAARVRRTVQPPAVHRGDGGAVRCSR